MPLFRKPPPTDRERTPEERAAEREERERRRAERAGVGRPPADPVPPGDAQPMPPVDAAPHDPAHDEPSRLPHEIGPAQDPALAPEPEPALAPEPEPALAPEPELVHDDPLAPVGGVDAGHYDPPLVAAEPVHDDPLAPVGGVDGGHYDPPLVAAEPVHDDPLAPVGGADGGHYDPPPVAAEPVHDDPLAPVGGVDAGHYDPPLVAAGPVHDDPLAPVGGVDGGHYDPPPVSAKPVHDDPLAPVGGAGAADPADGVLPAPEGVDEQHHAPTPHTDAPPPPITPAAGDVRPPPEAEPAASQQTMEHAALEQHDDKPFDGPSAPEPAIFTGGPGELGTLPPLPPLPPRRAAGAQRSRRDALLERRARRLNRPGQAGGPRAWLRPGRIVALLAIALVVAVLWFLVSLFQPLKGSGHGQVVVVIPHGSGAHAIGNLLAARGVVASGFFFDVRAAVDGERGRLHSGVYTFKRDMSYAAAISELVKPPPPVPVVRVVIPEGYARILIAGLARDDGLAGDYLAASKRSPLLNPTSYGAPRSTPHLEGFLFPATYDLKAGTDVTGLVNAQLTAFKSHFGPSQAPAARALHVSLYDLLIVASMVEREALLSRDRPLVAAVIYNRLRQHTPLGIDATIRYALNKWSSPLTVSDLRINSPYNTRNRDGLPPTPIGNPGVASIDAAAHPAHASYLYYVNGSDGCGDLKFSTSYAQFQANAAAYQAALAAHGGRVPSCKK